MPCSSSPVCPERSLSASGSEDTGLPPRQLLLRSILPTTDVGFSLEESLSVAWVPGSAAAGDQAGGAAAAAAGGAAAPAGIEVPGAAH